VLPIQIIHVCKQSQRISGLAREFKVYSVDPRSSCIDFESAPTLNDFDLLICVVVVKGLPIDSQAMLEPIGLHPHRICIDALRLCRSSSRAEERKAPALISMVERDVPHDVGCEFLLKDRSIRRFGRVRVPLRETGEKWRWTGGRVEQG